MLLIKYLKYYQYGRHATCVYKSLTNIKESIYNYEFVHDILIVMFKIYYQHFLKIQVLKLDFYNRNEFTKHHKENVSEPSMISPYVTNGHIIIRTYAIGSIPRGE